MFSAPPSLSPSGLTAYAAVFYILWGTTYTMMDIPIILMVIATLIFAKKFILTEEKVAEITEELHEKRQVQEEVK